MICGPVGEISGHFDIIYMACNFFKSLKDDERRMMSLFKAVLTRAFFSALQL